jgi:hypothetical protein
MFAELAISPSVFLGASFAAPEVCDAHLSGLKDVLLHATLTRNLRDGEYLNCLRGNPGLHERAKELLKAMFKQRRFVPHTTILPQELETPSAWTHEAIASHGQHPLQGILSCQAVKAEFRETPLVADVARRGSALWWQQEVLRSSWSIPRTIADYKRLLMPLYRQANSIRIVDPHVDPTRQGYRDFGELLYPLANRAEKPTIEIHRVCYRTSGGTKTLLKEAELNEIFRGLSDQLRARGLSAGVFVWADEHDRHILSDIGGVHLGNGLDVSQDPNAVVTWSRIDRTTQDDIARRHDPSVNGRFLNWSFTIGA